MTSPGSGSGSRSSHLIGDFVRGEAYLLNTYGFLAQNIVAAYENTELGLSFAGVATALGNPDDLLVTGTGTLDGGDNADIFYTGAGNEVLRGGEGPDTYLFGESIGHDVIDDIEPPLVADHVPDVIRFAHLTPADIAAARDGVDLILTVVATGETIRVERQFEGRLPSLIGGDLSDDTGVGEIIFADGTVWDLYDIAEAVRDPQATSDTVIGTGSIDYLDGGAGNDTLKGGEDGDRYFFDVGYDHDTVEDGLENVLIETGDMVIFGEGITSENLVLTRDGPSLDLVISISGNQDDSLTITDQFAAAYTGPFGQQWFDRIEIFAFSDGAYFTWKKSSRHSLRLARRRATTPSTAFPTRTFSTAASATTRWSAATRTTSISSVSATAPTRCTTRLTTSSAGCRTRSSSATVSCAKTPFSPATARPTIW